MGQSRHQCARAVVADAVAVEAENLKELCANRYVRESICNSIFCATPADRIPSCSDNVTGCARVLEFLKGRTLRQCRRQGADAVVADTVAPNAAKMVCAPVDRRRTPRATSAGSAPRVPMGIGRAAVPAAARVHVLQRLKGRALRQHSCQSARAVGADAVVVEAANMVCAPGDRRRTRPHQDSVSGTSPQRHRQSGSPNSGTGGRTRASEGPCTAAAPPPKRARRRRRCCSLQDCKPESMVWVAYSVRTAFVSRFPVAVSSAAVPASQPALLSDPRHNVVL